MIVAAVRGEPVLGRFRVAHVPDEDWAERRDCPACGSAAHLRDVGIVEGRERGPITAVCLECHLVFLRRRPLPEWFDRYYAEEWDAAGQDKWRSRRPRARHTVVDFCSPHLADGASVLDMGAGYGQDLLGFAERGYRARGLERSPHRAAYVEEVLGIPCATQPLERYDAPEAPSLVFLNHVFEHIDDPGRVLDHSHELLPDGGLIYIAVPTLWSEHAPESFHFVPHLFAHTARSLRRLLARHGFRTLRVEAGRDVQILAAKDPSAPTESGDVPGEPGSEELWREVAAWTERGFGAPGRDRVLVWSSTKNGSLAHESHVVYGGRVRYASLRRSVAANGQRRGGAAHLPKRGTAKLTEGKNLKMLPVRVRGDGELPVRVDYGDAPAPVWVK